MSEIILEVNNLSKKFCRNLKRSMMYGCADIMKDALAIPSNPEKLRKNEFWSVFNINFQLKRGECLGIIGPNGAGKSTLLKMLNGIIKPDQGSISYKGRMSALIEVGAGFHPILTGRENIYINGSIIGLSKADINKQFNNIVEFSGLEEFLDTPVKNYSSGMRVRLGFSIAAHLDPDILLVDEVLAVGDMSFQAKCKNKIEALVSKGTSIIFISHNMNLVSNLCPNSFLLHHGKMVMYNKTSKVIDKHKVLSSNSSPKEYIGPLGRIITSVELLDLNDKPVIMVKPNDPIKLRIHTYTEKTIKEPFFFVNIIANNETIITTLRNDCDNFIIKDIVGKSITDIIIPKFSFLSNTYNIDVGICQKDTFASLHKISDACCIIVSGGQKMRGFFNLEHKWKRHELH